jgi:hypothetical protein
LAAVLARAAELFGSVVWLSVLLCGLVTDMDGGPWWANVAIYAPTALIYGVALTLGIAWVRQAPRQAGARPPRPRPDRAPPYR